MKKKTVEWNNDNSILSLKYFILPSFRSFKSFEKMYLHCEIRYGVVIKCHKKIYNNECFDDMVIECKSSCFKNIKKILEIQSNA